MLAPVIGQMVLGSQGRAHRCTYLPLIQLSLVAIFEAEGFGERYRPARQALRAPTATALRARGALSFRWVEVWRDGISLLKHALSVTRGIERGRTAGEASHPRQAVANRPAYLEAANNLACLLATRPDISRADATRLARFRSGGAYAEDAAR